MNNCTIIGNLCNDPELRTTSSGKAVCAFRLAVDRRKKTEGQPSSDFFRVTAWSALAENCKKYLAKGKKVAVSGPVSVTTYQNKDGQFRATLEVLADEVEFLTPKEKEEDKGFVQVDGNDLPWG